MDAKAWIGLIVILLAAFMELLDVSVVSVAIPAIHSHERTVLRRPDPSRDRREQRRRDGAAARGARRGGRES
jgi:phage head maturation protease